MEGGREQGRESGKERGRRIHTQRNYLSLRCSTTEDLGPFVDLSWEVLATRKWLK